MTSGHDTLVGSSGSLIPLFEARLLGPEGQEIETLDTPGEVLLRSPSIFPGYLGDDEASTGAFDGDGWLRTGDIGMMKLGPNGTEHLFIVDRIKDMIKVKVRSVLMMSRSLMVSLFKSAGEGTANGLKFRGYKLCPPISSPRCVHTSRSLTLP